MLSPTATSRPRCPRPVTRSRALLHRSHPRPDADAGARATDRQRHLVGPLGGNGSWGALGPRAQVTRPGSAIVATRSSSPRRAPTSAVSSRSPDECSRRCSGRPLAGRGRARQRHPVHRAGLRRSVRAHVRRLRRRCGAGRWTQLEHFWEAVWDFYDLGDERPAANRCCPRAARCPAPAGSPARGSTTPNRCCDGRRSHRTCTARRRGGARRTVDWSAAQLRGRVGALAGALRDMGVGPGDRVAAYLPNIPEAVVAMLAVTSIGAIWSVCAPDFGTESVIDRFEQLEPSVLIAADGYRFAGKGARSPADVIGELLAGLGSVQADDPGCARSSPARALPARPRAEPFDQLVAQPAAPQRSSRLPFDDPLWILFSSGTTGRPKGIVHGHGGIVVEHLKSLGLCSDLGAQGHATSSTARRARWHGTTSSAGCCTAPPPVLYEGWPGFLRYRRPLATSPPTWGATVLGHGLGLRHRVSSGRGRVVPDRRRGAAHDHPDRLAAAADRMGLVGRAARGRHAHRLDLRRYRRLHCLLRRQPGTPVIPKADMRAGGWGSPLRLAPPLVAWSGRSASSSRPTRCPRCRLCSGTTQTSAATAGRTSRPSRGSGGRATGSRSTTAAALVGPRPLGCHAEPGGVRSGSARSTGWSNA